MPAAIIKLADNSSAILVDKGRARLYVYDGKEGLKESYNVISGKKKGDKEVRGDEKTPEGVYFFVDVIDGQELPSKYGVLAVTIDYPNPLDVAKGKTGFGIWLHATDDPSRLERPRDSRGCVVASNEDVLGIAEDIELGRTPVVIAEELDFIDGDEASRRSERIKEALAGLGYDVKAPQATILAFEDAVVVSFGGGESSDTLYFSYSEDGLLELEAKRSHKLELEEPARTVAEVYARLGRAGSDGKGNRRHVR